MTDSTSPQAPPGDRLFALIASIPGSGTVDWCGPARALLDEIAAPSAAVSPPPAADRAALLREAADRIEVLTNEAYERALSEDEIGYANGLENAMKELRRLAAGERDEQQAQANLDQLADDLAAAIASCPGRELDPNPCRCPCYGCKHHCGAHDPGRVDGEEQQAETQAREETGSALARYIVEQPVSVVQAALRILGWPPLRFELVDDPATPPAAVAEPGTEN